MGRFPAKDLEAFYKEEERSGNRRNWERRLITQISDRELITRHEVQQEIPDILITNYTMLEYMLLRPIEKDIFSETKKWLEQDKDNKFLLILDEAHMYRGSGGAEVALLIRRLLSRIGAINDKSRCILTTASIPTTIAKDKPNEILQFAEDISNIDKKNYVLIQGKEKIYSKTRKLNKKEITSLNNFDLKAFYNYADNLQDSVNEIQKLFRGLSISFSNEEIKSVTQLKNFVFKYLKDFEPILHIKNYLKKPRQIPDLSKDLTNSSKNEDIKSTEVLIQLGNFANQKGDGRVLLSTRMHLFFRGLSGIFACINSSCNKK